MNLAAATAYAGRHKPHALQIAQDGELVHESYGDGVSAETPHALYSGTKSFWGVLAIAAQEDGLLNLEERVAETIPAWGDDAEKRLVSLKQLLQLTSGVGFGGLGSSVPTYEKALATKLQHPPGTVFTYGGIPLQIFGAVLSRKLAASEETPHAYLQRRILNPAGVHVASWRSLKDGTHPLPTGAFLSAAQWRKYGELIRENESEYAPCFVGSLANPRYGLGWWLAPPGTPGDTRYASGAGGQGLYIVPSQRIVAVRFGESASFKHDAFLKRLFS